VTTFRVTRFAKCRISSALALASLLASCGPRDLYESTKLQTEGGAERIGSLSAQVCGRQALSQDQIRSLVEQAVQDLPIESLVSLSRPSIYASGMSAYGIDRQRMLMEWLIAQKAIVYTSERFGNLPHAGPMGVEDSLAIRAGAVHRPGQLIIAVDANDLKDGIQAGAAALSSLYRYNLRMVVGVQGYGSAGPRHEFFGLPYSSARLGGVSLDFIQGSCPSAVAMQ